ncbi:MAG: ABC transporter substrate-binding protein [Lachnospiraceae bacterium]|nr:ABC transporter substrate-binding protein [Lachnospiraceae bacterium]
MKKRIIATLLGGLMALNLIACGSTAATTGAEGAPAAADTAAADDAAADAAPADDSAAGGDSSGVTLTFLASQDWIYDAEQELGAKFEEETGIHIDYQIVPADQYFTLLMTKLNSGEGPDIFGGQSGKYDIVSQYDVEANAVDLSNEPWVANYSEFEKEQTSVGDVVYGSTYFDTTTDFYMVYNKVLFEQAGIKEVPTTFDEYMADCKKLTDAGIVPFYECTADGWHHVMWFCEIGGRFEEKNPGLAEKLNNNEIKFADVEDFKTCLEQIKQMADEGTFGDNYQSDEYSGMAAALGSGEYAMTMAKPGTISEIADASNGQYTVDDFGMFYIPTLDNQVLNVHPCGPTRFIYSGSEHIDEAKKYFEFMTSAESIQYMIDNEPKVENLPYEVGQKPAYSDYTKNFIDNSAKKGTVYQDSIKYLNPQWFDFGQDIIAYLNGDMTVDEVLTKVDDRRTEQAQAANDPAWAE